MAMATSSFAPMRRERISFSPAFASKYHLSPTFTSGAGKGQLSLPTRSCARCAFFGSTDMSSFSCALAANCVAFSRSCACSPVITMSLPWAPKILPKEGSSNFSAAATSASAASFGVAKPSAPAGGVVLAFVEDCCAPTMERATHTHAMVDTIQRNLKCFSLVDLIIVSCTRKSAIIVAICAVHHRHHRDDLLRRRLRNLLGRLRLRGTPCSMRRDCRSYVLVIH